MLAIVTIGFLAGLVASPPDPEQAIAGLVPRLDGAERGPCGRHARRNGDAARHLSAFRTDP